MYELPDCVKVQQVHCGGVVSGVVTVRERFAERVIPPSVPRTNKLYVPVGVELAVLIVRVDEPELLSEAGLKLAEAPEGSPVTLRFTADPSDFRAVTVTVTLVCAF